MDIQSSAFDFASEYLDSKALRNLGFLQVGDNVRISRNSTIIGVENIKIGSNVRIDSYNVIIARRGTLSIGDNVHIENCKIGPHVSIGNNTKLVNSVVTNSIIQTNVKVNNCNINNSMVGNFAELNGANGSLSISDYSTIQNS